MKEKNKGGRPLIHTDPRVVEDLINEYFNTIGESPPTVTGLALHIGFSSKSTLYQYSKKERFSYPIKKGLTRIEMYHEEKVAYGDKCTGNIFVLKNFGWKDKQTLSNYSRR